MSINFPDNPNINDTFDSGVAKWIWTGTVWNLFDEPIELPKRPVHKVYASQIQMFSDQSNQVYNYLYFDGTTYWVYLGTTNGDITDYRLLDTTVPQYVKDITEQDIDYWNNKLDRNEFESENIQSGITQTIFSVDKVLYKSIFIDYYVFNTVTKGTRSGNIIGVWDSTFNVVEFTDYSTNDLITSTETINLTLNIVSNNLNVDVETSIPNWNIKILVKLL
jgi:hypothetical protein